MAASDPQSQTPDFASFQYEIYAGGLIEQTPALPISAAALHGLPFILSTAASHSIEEVAEAMGEGSRWYQLYWPRDRELAASFVSRAERAGYGAIVLTLDTWFLGWRPRDLQHAYLPFLKGQGVANYLS